MSSKTLHIIPHSHWDREWYMGFERHRMRLVELFDTLIDVMEKDPQYKYYHMDGQYVVIEDYLEVRPQMRDRLLKLIREDRIQVGPWYILQDEYLISGESNVRNMLYGIKFCKEIGANPVMCGYFPDAFGNISQAPQIVRGFGIDNAVFGRGVSEVGADNKIAEKKNPSEWVWRSPDGSEVVGVMFSHWYCNAMELPTDYEALKEKLLRMVSECEASGYTPHYLGMNGCDHQPIQTDLTKAIELGNEILKDKDIKVIESNFKDYIEAVKPYSDTFPRVTGELNGQGTNGLYMLVDTASTHIPLKQFNHKVQNLLTQQTEPVSVFTNLKGDKYREDMIIHAWKKLMQNHPHDSICCCSSDEVTDEMYSRFSASLQTGEYVRDEALDFLKKNVKAENKSVLVFHTVAGTGTKVVKANLDYPVEKKLKGISLKAPDGTLIPVSYKLKENIFTYTLPKDSFRKVKFVNRYEIEFPVTMNGIGYQLFEVIEEDYNEKLIKVYEKGAENENLSFTIENNGSLTIEDKRSGKIYKNVNIIEDSADKGDSYNYKPLESGTITSENSVAQISLEKETAYSVTFKVKVTLDIPFTHDKKVRSEEKVKTDIVSHITLTSGINRVDIRTEYLNGSENHRLRALFDCEIDTHYSVSEGQFDLTKRNITPWEGWLNPSFCQRSQSFFALENEDYGFAVATRGLNEYEILRNGKNTAAVTILRSTGEIGDWGDFPTPKMQLMGKGEVEYSFVPYGSETKVNALSVARDFSDDAYLTADMDVNEGALDSKALMVSMDNEKVSTSAFKRSECGEYAVLRVYNPYEEDAETELNVGIFTELYESDLAENKGAEISLENGKAKITVKAKKILTFLLK